MILIICIPCSLAIRVIGELEEVYVNVGPKSDFWPDKFQCPVCEGKAKGILEVEADATALAQLKVSDLTVQEAFIAFHGMGLPTEKDCSKSRVDDLFSTPIRRVKGMDRSGRFLLEYIEFWDGTRMYLGACPDGAIVYKISAPPSYASACHE